MDCQPRQNELNQIGVARPLKLDGELLVTSDPSAQFFGFEIVEKQFVFEGHYIVTETDEPTCPQVVNHSERGFLVTEELFGCSLELVASAHHGEVGRHLSSNLPQQCGREG